MHACQWLDTVGSFQHRPVGPHQTHGPLPGAGVGRQRPHLARPGVEAGGAPDLSDSPASTRPRSRIGQVRHFRPDLQHGRHALHLFQSCGCKGCCPSIPRACRACPADLAFNTAASFTTNTNWQNYGGESTLSYLSQMVALASHNFLSAAAGIAIAAALVRGIARDKAATLGNFWTDLTRICLYLLLPTLFGVCRVSGLPGDDPELSAPTKPPRCSILIPPRWPKRTPAARRSRTPKATR